MRPEAARKGLQRSLEISLPSESIRRPRWIKSRFRAVTAGENFQLGHLAKIPEHPVGHRAGRPASGQAQQDRVVMQASVWDPATPEVVAAILEALER
jgi:hypothetical protein